MQNAPIQKQPVQNQVKKKEKTIEEQLTSIEKYVAKALPKHLDVQEMLSYALTEFRTNPELKQCTLKSFLGAVLKASHYGLYIGSTLGKAYPVPFRNKKTGQKECQLILGYRGMIELAHRSNLISTFEAECVYQKDFFKFELGTDKYLKHIPFGANTNIFEQQDDNVELMDPDDINRGQMFAAYAIAKMKTGDYQFKVMFKSEINDIRKRSQAKNFSAWVTDYDEMAAKTVIRRLYKQLPTSTKLMQDAVIFDEKADRGEQNLAQEFDIITGNSLENEQEEVNQNDHVKNMLRQEEMI